MAKVFPGSSCLYYCHHEVDDPRHLTALPKPTICELKWDVRFYIATITILQKTCVEKGVTKCVENPHRALGNRKGFEMSRIRHLVPGRVVPLEEVLRRQNGGFFVDFPSSCVTCRFF